MRAHHWAAEVRAECHLSPTQARRASDPGYSLVRAAQAEHINVTMIPGARRSGDGAGAFGLPSHSFTFAVFLRTRRAHAGIFMNLTVRSHIPGLLRESLSAAGFTAGCAERIRPSSGWRMT